MINDEIQIGSIDVFQPLIFMPMASSPPRPKRVKPAPTEGQKNYAKYLRSDEWSKLRDSALEAGGHKCIICRRTDKVQVHHLDYGKKGDLSDVGLDSLVCLCNGHHMHYHASELLEELILLTPRESRVNVMKAFFIGSDHLDEMKRKRRLNR